MLHKLLLVGLAALMSLTMGIARPEQKLFHMHNDVRAAYLVQPLHANEVLFPLAEHQARRMAHQGRLFHGLYPVCPGGWGQNVGVGPSVFDVFQGFMASRDHRRNILNPNFHWVGIGVVIDQAGNRWVVVDFCR